MEHSLFSALFSEMNELYKEKLFLTMEDVTSLLSCSKTVVYNWAKRMDPKKRPPRIIVGKEVRFPKREFLKWLMDEQGGARMDGRMNGIE
jgi:predicted DNA-binding transcriptional regulator AlpA